MGTRPCLAAGLCADALGGVSEQRGARVTESAVPESDEESVRVMTIHAAKGLEFPVVALTGMNSDRGSRGDTVLFDRRNGRVEVGVGPEQDRISTAGYEELKVREGLMSNAEDVRLMYVATTRARDHLVLSLRRSADGRGERTRAAAISRHLAASSPAAGWRGGGWI